VRNASCRDINRVLSEFRGLETTIYGTVPRESEALVIHSSVGMTLPANRLQEALEILGPMAEQIRMERGCLACHLHRDALEENVLILEESWASEADLERHLRSQDYRQLLLVMELARVPPEVRFDRVSHSTGLETIQAARG
jgi:quinol monooxygenase YgiN